MRGIGVAVITSTCGVAVPDAAAQRVALLDAEAVLLVDDDQAEVGEPDAVLDQRVGADDDARLPGLRIEQRLPLRPWRPATR